MPLTTVKHSSIHCTSVHVVYSRLTIRNVCIKWKHIINVSRKNVSTSCCSRLLARGRTHRCCPLANKVENIDCPSMTLQKCPFLCGNSGPPTNTWFLGPTQVHVANGISIGSSVFAGIQSRPTDTHTQTDHATRAATSRILCYAPRCDLITRAGLKGAGPGPPNSRRPPTKPFVFYFSLMIDA